MKVFPIPESELKTLGFVNWLTALVLSLSASMFTFLGSIVIAIGLTDHLTDTARFIKDYGEPLFAPFWNSVFNSCCD
jgi:hypothetical protein